MTEYFKSFGRNVGCVVAERNAPSTIQYFSRMQPKILKMGYKAIIFDLDNTLLNFELCERQAILGALEDCGVSLDLNGVSFLRKL